MVERFPHFSVALDAVALEGFDKLVTHTLHSAPPARLDSIPCFAFGSHVETIEGGNDVMDKSFPQKFRCAGGARLDVLLRIYSIGLASLPAVEVLLPLFFNLLKLVFELFQFCFRGADVSKLILGFEINIIFSHSGRSVSKKVVRN